MGSQSIIIKMRHCRNALKIDGVIQMIEQVLVRAFDAFFRRLAAGQTPGYPRFKSIERYPGWGYKAHGDGWTLLRKGAGFGAVRLSAVGTVSLAERTSGAALHPARSAASAAPQAS